MIFCLSGNFQNNILAETLCEDNALGRLPDARYAALDAQYAKEQEALSKEITELEKSVKGYDQGKRSAEKFIAMIDKYQDFDTMKQHKHDLWRELAGRAGIRHALPNLSL